jgi:hypothetical protein
MRIENILKKKYVTNRDIYDCCLILLREYLSRDNQILLYSIKYIKYDIFFCNNINKVLKSKLDDKTLFITIEYYIYAYIYRKLLQYIYLYEQNTYEQDVYEPFKLGKNIKLPTTVSKGVTSVTKTVSKGVTSVTKTVVGGATKTVVGGVTKTVVGGVTTVTKTVVKVAKDTASGIANQMISHVNKLNNSRKCLASGDFECVFKNIKDIATDLVPAINIIDKLARGEKVTTEDMIMLAISVAPVPGGPIIGVVGKVVVKSAAKAVVKNIMHDPKTKSKIENIVNKTMAKNKNIKPDELKKIVANEVNQITLEEMNKEEVAERAAREKETRERTEKETRERTEKEAREKAEKEAREKAREKADTEKSNTENSDTDKADTEESNTEESNTERTEE